MSTFAQNQQLQQELINELSVSNQLLRQISIELQHIKSMTNPGGDLEANIIQNATLIEKLAKAQQINLQDLSALEKN